MDNTSTSAGSASIALSGRLMDCINAGDLLVYEAGALSPVVTSTTGIVNGAVSTISNIVYSEPEVKVCRNCKHCHLAGQEMCINVSGFIVTFATCPCKEYIPSDNLEYMEWCYNKQHKEESK